MLQKTRRLFRWLFHIARMSLAERGAQRFLREVLKDCCSASVIGAAVAFHAASLGTALALIVAMVVTFCLSRLLEGGDSQ